MQRVGVAPTYEAIGTFVDQAQRRDGSLFDPGRPVWALVDLDDLDQRFTKQPDVSSDSFLDKLHRQLADAPATAVQLCAEVVYVHLLVAGDIGGTAKRALVTEILSWSPDLPPVPPSLDRAFDTGLAHTGVAFKTYRDLQLSFLIDVGRAWKRLPEADREVNLSEPWAFKAFLVAVPIKAAFAQRNALLHFVHPDTFEITVSREHKERIVSAFHELSHDETDEDRALLAIRRALEAEQGHAADFYRLPLRERWNPKGSRRAWLVRGANVDGVNRVQEWLDDGYCSVGWHEVGDLPGGVSRLELQQRVDAAYPDDSAAARRAHVGNLYRFLSSIQIGDVVVTPDGDDVYVGTVD